MQHYLVGGAVRDELLGQSVKDRDYVVVGETPAAMLERGFKPVGKGFPVFLHPTTSEEYALARTERKVGAGHCGFEVVADPSVTLEDDLLRRDLTINAIARDLSTGSLVDPHRGVEDLRAGLLRHVSGAFQEDPLRVLRVARFAARYAPLGFQVAPETMALMAMMTQRGDLNELTAERVWGEVSKALKESSPEVFLQVLRRCGALAVIAPEIDVLYGVPQVAEHHPEIDTGIHTEMVVAQAARLAPGDARVAFAAMTHDLGKGLTPANEWPRHLKHEENGVVPVEALCKRWKVPNEFRELAVNVCRHHLTAHLALEIRPGTTLDLFVEVGAMRQPEKLEPFILACEADARGRLGLENRDYPQSQALRDAHAAALSITAAPYVAAGKVGVEVGKAVEMGRRQAIAVLRNNRKAQAQGRGPKPL